MSTFEGSTFGKSLAHSRFFSQVKLLHKFYANDFRDFAPEQADFLGSFKKSIKQTLKLSTSGLTFGDKVSEVLTGVPYEHISFDKLKLVYQDKIYPKVLVCVITSRRPSYNYEIITYQTSKSHHAEEYEMVFKELATGQKIIRKTPLKSTENSIRGVNTIKINRSTASRLTNVAHESHLERPGSSKSFMGSAEVNGIKPLKLFKENESVVSGSSRRHPSASIHNSVHNIHFEGVDRRNNPHNPHNRTSSISSHLPRDHSNFHMNHQVPSPPRNQPYSTEARVIVGGRDIPQTRHVDKSIVENFQLMDITEHRRVDHTNGYKNSNFNGASSYMNGGLHVRSMLPQHSDRILIKDSDSDEDAVNYRQYFAEQSQSRQHFNRQSSPQRYRHLQHHHLQQQHYQQQHHQQHHPHTEQHQQQHSHTEHQYQQNQQHYRPSLQATPYNNNLLHSPPNTRQIHTQQQQRQQIQQQKHHVSQQQHSQYRTHSNNRHHSQFTTQHM